MAGTDTRQDAESIRRRAKRHLRRFGADDRRAIVVMVALVSVVILGMAGLAVDLGRGYVAKAQMSRAVDAGVLAAARSLRQGQTVAEQQALALAEANGVVNNANTTLSVSFGTNQFGENTVSMSGSREVPTSFMKVFGIQSMDVGSVATSAIPPVDLVLVLDQSGSLANAGAWDDLQDAAIQFVQNFDDQIDQIGLVSFQIRGTDRFQIDGDFTDPIEDEVEDMESAGDTNVGEGLRLALEQFERPNVRERSAKVVVFFTDGRPTAFRGLVGEDAPADGGSALGPFEPEEEDAILAVYTTNTGDVRGLFENPDDLDTDAAALDPDDCEDVPNCEGWTESDVRDKGIENEIRSRDIFLYTIGLGNPGAGDPLLTPDQDYLRELANEQGQTNPNQVTGRFFFAPDASDLQEVFNLVANELLVRLAQ